MADVKFDQLINRALDLYDQIKADEDIRRKAISFSSHVKEIDVMEPSVNEEQGIITEYIKVVTDVGDVYIPLQFSTLDATRIHDTARLLHQFITTTFMPLLKDLYSVIKENSSSITSPTDEKIIELMSNAVGRALIIVTDQDVSSMADKIGENISNIELIADTSDERTYDLVKIENIKNTEEISHIATDLLDFVNRIWNAILYPFISSFINT